MAEQNQKFAKVAVVGPDPHIAELERLEVRLQNAEIAVQNALDEQRDVKRTLVEYLVASGRVDLLEVKRARVRAFIRHNVK